MIYGINDRPSIGKWLLLSLQIVLAVFVATVLIANICGVNVGASLVGAGLGTLAYLGVTKFKSPMFISNSGNYVALVISALALGGYSGVLLGGLVSCIVYCIFGFIFTKIPVVDVYKIFPRALIGSVTCVIGITLMSFIPSYIGDTGNIGLMIALVTMLSTALYSQYISKGTLSMFPFLLGLLTGYIVAIPFGLVDFSVFNGIGLFSMPTFAFTLMTPITGAIAAAIIIKAAAFSVSGMMEGLADHGALSSIINKDLYENPGLGRIFFGEGLANIIGTFFGGLNQCSYGEGVATVGFSKCASTFVTAGAAIILILLGFLSPVQAFIASIPSACFAGSAMILYGFIAASGIKQIQKVDLDIKKNLLIVSVVLSIGISGVVLGGNVISISGTALALIVGVILNLILKDQISKEPELTEEEAMADIPSTEEGTEIKVIEW